MYTTMLIFGNSLKESFCRTKRQTTLKLGMQHSIFKYMYCQLFLSNNDPGLILTYFTTRSNLVLKSEISKLVDAVNYMITLTCMNIKGQGHSVTGPKVSVFSICKLLFLRNNCQISCGASMEMEGINFVQMVQVT